MLLLCILLCAMGYSRGIHGMFTEYSWSIHMYRVCVGYVSGMCRECVDTNRVRVGFFDNLVERDKDPTRRARDI